MHKKVITLLDNKIDFENSIPLIDEETRAQMNQDLDALEKKTINGWDSIYPVLFKNLNSIIEDLSSIMECSPPTLVIRFEIPTNPIPFALQNYQASLVLLTDGSSQIHIGAHFIREFLLNCEEKNLVTLHRAFLWSIAHELGHAVDKKFKTWGKLYRIRAVFDRVTGIIFIGGAFSYFMPTQIMLFNQSIFLVSIGLIAVKKLFTIMLHREFEYTADRTTLSLGFNTEDINFALTTMTFNIKNCISRKTAPTKNAGLLGKLISSAYRKITLLKSFALHPSITSRINKITKS